jgi:hypothetical protein
MEAIVQRRRGGPMGDHHLEFLVAIRRPEGAPNGSQRVSDVVSDQEPKR